MFRRITIISLCLLVFQGTASGSDDLPRILDGLKKNYGGLDAISIPYAREVVTRSMVMLGNQAKGDLATGTIYFRAPDLLRLEQEKPRVETIIANSMTMWWVIPAKKTVYEYKTEEFGKELRLMTNILRGLAQVEDSFYVKLQEKDEAKEKESPGVCKITLIPNPPWEEIQKIDVTVGDDFHIQTVKIYNFLGSVTIFTLEKFTEIHTLDKRFFTFTAQKGMKVIVQ